MQKHSAGFTLIEVMIALAIVATALPSLMMLVTNQVRGAGFIREKTQAYWIAEDQLTRINLRHKLLPLNKLPETQSGTILVSDAEWFWEMNSESTEIENFKRIDVRVSLNANKNDTLARLAGFIDEQ